MNVQLSTHSIFVEKLVEIMSEKTVFIKTKYKMRIIGLIMLFIIPIVIAVYMKIRSFFLLNNIDAFLIFVVDFLIFISLLFDFFYGLIFFLRNGYAHTYVIPKPIMLVVDDLDYKKIMNLISSYCNNTEYNQYDLYLDDTGHEERFTLFKNKKKEFKIGIYYSDKYYAEYIEVERNAEVGKSIRLSNLKEVNSKVVFYVDEFRRKEEYQYSMSSERQEPNGSLSINSAIPITSIVIVVLKERKKYQDFEWDFLEREHEEHVLFVLVYEDNANEMWIGSDVRLYKDESYKVMLAKLIEMLDIKYVNIDALIELFTNGMR